MRYNRYHPHFLMRKLRYKKRFNNLTKVMQSARCGARVGPKLLGCRSPGPNCCTKYSYSIWTVITKEVSKMSELTNYEGQKWALWPVIQTQQEFGSCLLGWFFCGILCRFLKATSFLCTISCVARTNLPSACLSKTNEYYSYKFQLT